jgi:NADH-quinone oxidoreductase subunit L
VTLPLILLAIPSVIIGFIAIEPMLFGDFFNGVILVDESHHAMEELTKEFHGAVGNGRACIYVAAIHSRTCSV